MAGRSQSTIASYWASRAARLVGAPRPSVRHAAPPATRHPCAVPRPTAVSRARVLVYLRGALLPARVVEPAGTREHYERARSCAARTQHAADGDGHAGRIGLDLVGRCSGRGPIRGLKFSDEANWGPTQTRSGRLNPGPRGPGIPSGLGAGRSQVQIVCPIAIGAKTAGELDGGGLVVIAAEQHATRVVVPVEPADARDPLELAQGHRCQGLAKLAGPHVPISLRSSSGPSARPPRV